MVYSSKSSSSEIVVFIRARFLVYLLLLDGCEEVVQRHIIQAVIKAGLDRLHAQCERGKKREARLPAFKQGEYMKCISLFHHNCPFASPHTALHTHTRQNAVGSSHKLAIKKSREVDLSYFSHTHGLHPTYLENLIPLPGKVVCRAEREQECCHTPPAPL